MLVNLPHPSAEVSESFEISLSDDLSTIEQLDENPDKTFCQSHGIGWHVVHGALLHSAVTKAPCSVHRIQLAVLAHTWQFATSA